MTDEQFVKGAWERAELCGRSCAAFCISLGGRGFTRANVPDRDTDSSKKAWAAAAEFTRERLEQIRQVQEEKYLLLGMIALLASEPGDLTAPIYKRTVARLESALADLRKGML